MHIRSAAPAEAGALSELALRAKAHWGYDDAFLEACRAELTIRIDRLRDETIRVADDGGVIVGFSAVGVTGAHAELLDLFVAPDRIGRGVGRMLWEDALGTARAAGATLLRIEADPHAEEWYLHRGAVRVGDAPSGSIAGRMLPLLEVRTGSADT